MTPLCPRCQSSKVVTRNHARKAGGTLGAAAGAASSFSTAIKGAEVGHRLGLLGGPTGMAVGTIAGAVLGGLLGAAAGCSAGIALGELIDDKVLDNYRCLACAHTFTRASAGTASASSTFAASAAPSEHHWFTADPDEPLD